MSNLTEKYKMVLEGKMSRTEFLRQARQGFPQQISQFTTYDDAVKIFKNKGMLSEEIEYQCVGDKFPLEQIEKGLRYELKEMGLSDMCIPTPKEYMEAKKKAIDNLVKDSQYYVKKIEEGKMFLQEADEKKPRISKEDKKRRSDKAQQIFIALMKSKVPAGTRWKSDMANSALRQARKMSGLLDFVPVRGTYPPNLYFDSKDDKFYEAVSGGDAARKRWTSEGQTKEGKLLKEAIAKVVTRVLNEAATTNLADLSDQNASIEGIPAILNSLENIVTEIESFILKEQTKVQGVFDGIGNIKNEDNIPIGYKFVQPIMNAFAQDLQPVLDKISLDNIKVPEAPESLGDEELQTGDEPVGPGIDPENLEMTPEDKATLFTPKGTKPNPLA